MKFLQKGILFLVLLLVFSYPRHTQALTITDVIDSAQSGIATFFGGIMNFLHLDSGALHRSSSADTRGKRITTRNPVTSTTPPQQSHST